MKTDIMKKQIIRLTQHLIQSIMASGHNYAARLPGLVCYAAEKVVPGGRIFGSGRDYIPVRGQNKKMLPRIIVLLTTYCCLLSSGVATPPNFSTYTQHTVPSFIIASDQAITIDKAKLALYGTFQENSETDVEIGYGSIQSKLYLGEQNVTTEALGIYPYSKVKDLVGQTGRPFVKAVIPFTDYIPGPPSPALLNVNFYFLCYLIDDDINNYYKPLAADIRGINADDCPFSLAGHEHIPGDEYSELVNYATHDDVTSAISAHNNLENPHAAANFASTTHTHAYSDITGNIPAATLYDRPGSLPSMQIGWVSPHHHLDLQISYTGTNSVDGQGEQEETTIVMNTAINTAVNAHNDDTGAHAAANFATTSAINTAVNAHNDVAGAHTAAGFATTSAMNTAITTAISNHNDDTGAHTAADFATTSAMNTAITAHNDVAGAHTAAGFATTSAMNTAINTAVNAHNDAEDAHTAAGFATTSAMNTAISAHNGNTGSHSGGLTTVNTAITTAITVHNDAEGAHTAADFASASHTHNYSELTGTIPVHTHADDTQGGELEEGVLTTLTTNLSTNQTFIDNVANTIDLSLFASFNATQASTLAAIYNAMISAGLNSDEVQASVNSIMTASNSTFNEAVKDLVVSAIMAQRQNP